MKNQNIIGLGNGSLKSYLIGFIISIILTGIPFYLIMTSSLSSAATITIIFFAATQILIHLTCFLHVRFSFSQRWSSAALTYTLVLLWILVGASIFIMYHLKANM
jgi:cytochrome o ubiquinol oxidase operon protein cyoD